MSGEGDHVPGIGEIENELCHKSCADAGSIDEP